MDLGDLGAWDFSVFGSLGGWEIEECGSWETDGNSRILRCLEIWMDFAHGGEKDLGDWEPGISVYQRAWEDGRFGECGSLGFLGKLGAWEFGRLGAWGGFWSDLECIF